MGAKSLEIVVLMAEVMHTTIIPSKFNAARKKGRATYWGSKLPDVCQVGKILRDGCVPA
jgi:hypothetical protein